MMDARCDEKNYLFPFKNRKALIFFLMKVNPNGRFLYGLKKDIFFNPKWNIFIIRMNFLIIFQKQKINFVTKYLINKSRKRFQ